MVATETSATFRPSMREIVDCGTPERRLNSRCVHPTAVLVSRTEVAMRSIGDAVGVVRRVAIVKRYQTALIRRLPVT